MDASLISSLRVALMNTLGGALQNPSQIDTPRPLAASTSAPSTGHNLTGGVIGDVTGIVSYTGSLVGTITLSMALDTALGLAHRMAGLPITTETQPLDDAAMASIAESVGELLAMVAMSSLFSSTAHDSAMASCPTVIIGPGHRIACAPDTPTVQIRCATELGELLLDVSVRPSPGSIPAAA